MRTFLERAAKGHLLGKFFFFKLKKKEEFSGLKKTDPQNSVDNRIMTLEFFRLFLDSKLSQVHNRVEGGRYAKAPRRDFRFPPGLLVVVDFVAPGNFSPRDVLYLVVVGTRENATCALHARRVVFRS